MESGKKELLKLLFPDGYSNEWHYNSKLNEYLAKLGGYKVEELLKELARLEEEKCSILEQTQDLAVSNYKTFVATSQCSRQLFSQFSTIDSKLMDLLVHVPKFEEKCSQFAEETNGINNLRKLNSLTLTRNAQLLEILELPQLMNNFINDRLYEDALELATYVRKLYARHPEIPIFKSILGDVEKAWLLMLDQLLNQLRQELTLPKCLQIVGHLRRMEVFTETELRLKFLQTRNVWLQNCLKYIPKGDVNHHLNKTIEVTRNTLFNIITQYKAVFNEDDHCPLAVVKAEQINQNVIFFSWIKDKVSEFLQTLEEDLNHKVTSIESILAQCMYFGSSFSKVGCDFRPSLIPIFNRKIQKTFNFAVTNAVKNFKRNIDRFTLINKNQSNVSSWKATANDPLQPPISLLEFYPLAEFLNNISTAFNELRVCAPIGVINSIINSLQNALIFIAKSILTLHAQEQQAFTAMSKDAFTRLCMCFADDLVPYIQKCIHTIFPPTNIAAILGINVQILQTEQISFLNKNLIIEPIKHLLLIKVEDNDNDCNLIDSNVTENKIEISNES